MTKITEARINRANKEELTAILSCLGRMAQDKHIAARDKEALRYRADFESIESRFRLAAERSGMDQYESEAAFLEYLW